QERPKKKQTLSQEEAYQTQPELSKYHTYDLLLLLSYLREQRSTAYKTMQSVRKAPNEVKTSRNDYDELNEYGQEFYREATARKNIIEQILIDRMGYYPMRSIKICSMMFFLDRMGYYPKRVNNKLLDALESKI